MARTPTPPGTAGAIKRCSGVLHPSPAPLLLRDPPRPPTDTPPCGEGGTFRLTSRRDCREGDFFMPGPSGGVPPGAGSCSML